MEYLSSEKNWKYHLKSALVTFGSTFSLLFAAELLKYGYVLQNLKPEDITFAAISSGAVTLARIAFIAVLKSLWTFVKKVR